MKNLSMLLAIAAAAVTLTGCCYDYNDCNKCDAPAPKASCCSDYNDCDKCPAPAPKPCEKSCNTPETKCCR